MRLRFAIAIAITITIAIAPGCYLSHEIGDGSAIEVGRGVDGFEPIPREGAVLAIVPHPRGGWGLALAIRLRGVDPLEGAVTCAVADPASGDLLAAPRFDEPHRFFREGTDWVSSGTLALFASDLAPADLDGTSVRVEATLVTRGGEAFADSRRVTLEASDD